MKNCSDTSSFKLCKYSILKTKKCKGNLKCSVLEEGIERILIRLVFPFNIKIFFTVNVIYHYNNIKNNKSSIINVCKQNPQPYL